MPLIERDDDRALMPVGGWAGPVGLIEAGVITAG
jgi:hypothetical protein